MFHADSTRPSLQSLASIISQNLSSISQHLNGNDNTFASMVVYPLPNFPGKTQENLLGQLLRKKLEPNVEDWVAEGRGIATDVVEHSDRAFDIERVQDLWTWAGMAANEQARQHTWGGNYTLEERAQGIENVTTGLRRTLKDDEADSSEDDEDAMKEDRDGNEMEIVRVHRKSGTLGGGLEFDLTRDSDLKSTSAVSSAMPIEDVFRFLMTGTTPNT